MSAVTVNPATQAQLSSVYQVVALTDAQGRILGHFIPAIDPEIRKAMEPDISEEELDRREQEGGGRPLKEILDDLEKRA
jgi:hypothetical protein